MLLLLLLLAFCYAAVAVSVAIGVAVAGVAVIAAVVVNLVVGIVLCSWYYIDQYNCHNYCCCYHLIKMLARFSRSSVFQL